jgi:hypothetical protein
MGRQGEKETRGEGDKKIKINSLPHLFPTFFTALTLQGVGAMKN